MTGSYCLKIVKCFSNSHHRFTSYDRNVRLEYDRIMKTLAPLANSRRGQDKKFIKVWQPKGGLVQYIVQ